MQFLRVSRHCFLVLSGNPNNVIPQNNQVAPDPNSVQASNTADGDIINLAEHPACRGDVQRLCREEFPAKSDGAKITANNSLNVLECFLNHVSSTRFENSMKLTPNFPGRSSCFGGMPPGEKRTFFCMFENYIFFDCRLFGNSRKISPRTAG